jgi:hypothetical protein
MLEKVMFLDFHDALATFFAAAPMRCVELRENSLRFNDAMM